MTDVLSVSNMRNRYSVKIMAQSDRITKKLLEVINSEKSVYVGVDTASYFQCAQTTFNRTVKNLVESGSAKLFYMRFYTLSGKDGEVSIRKVLTPPSWSFTKAMIEKENIVTLTDDSILSSAETRMMDTPKSMMNHRIRQLKKAGYSNVRIGVVLGMNESTVRRRLKTPLEPIEILLDKILFDLEDARTDILSKMMDHPELQTVFKDDSWDSLNSGFLFNIHTNSRNVEIDPDRKRIKFSLNFVATFKE